MLKGDVDAEVSYGIAVFKFPAGAHNVWLLPTQTAYDNCDITQAIELDAGATGVYTVRCRS